MKNNIFTKGCLALAAMCIMSSCDDFLQEDPQSLYTSEAFYTTESDFQYSVSAIYSAMTDILDGTRVSGSSYGLFRFPSVRADEKSLFYNINFYAENAQCFLDNSQVICMADTWEYMYIMINRANCILDRVDEFTFSSDKVKNDIKGQALALRGYAYNTLGLYFGGVPLILKEASVDDALATARSTQEETFNQALSDYKAAAALLQNKYTGSDYGRIGKYAVESLMARLYLFMGNKSSAQPLLKDVIDNGGYALEPVYANAFSEEKEGGSERVFEAVYLANQSGYGCSNSESWIGQTYSQLPTDDFKYTRSGSSCAMSLNEDIFKNEFEAGDVRKNEFKTGLKCSSYAPEYIYTIKYCHYSEFATGSALWGVNIPLVRYADVLLMYAECLGAGAGDQYINAVRQRAGLGAWTEYSNDFMTALKHERKIEFLFEGLRWFDLVRWGDAVNVMNAYHKTIQGGNGQYKMNAGQELFAIPQKEIDVYGDESKMWQNPYYK